MNETFDSREQFRLHLNRTRGWIICLLYTMKPRPLAFGTIKYLLDARNHMLSTRRLAEELDYLRNEGLLVVAPVKTDKTLTDGDQHKLLLRYQESSGEMDNMHHAVLTNKAIQFQEHNIVDIPGVMRIE